MARPFRLRNKLLFVLGRSPKWWLMSLLLWCVLTSYHTNEVPSSLMGQNVQLIIAHPDDEVMFFAPALIELGKPQNRNNISVTCFSTGNAEGLGPVRSLELERSLEIMGIHQVELLDDESRFKDSMDIIWHAEDIVEFIHPETTVILTFDDGGVSNHPNHRSLYHAAMTTGKRVAALHTYPLWQKYSATFMSNYELIWRSTDENEVVIHSNWGGYLLALAAMVSGHTSQMEWFRYGWLLLSNYLNMNRLIIH